MIVRYSRGGGRRPPPDREILTVEEDGSFAMWRSVGAAVQPPSPVGQFAGQIGAQALESLKIAIEAATLAGDLVIKPKPGSALLNIDTGRVKATLGIHDEPNDAWSGLTQILKGLLKQLTDSPKAAIKLTVSEDGQVARLEHLGLHPLQLDLSQLTVRAVLWEGYVKKNDWSLSERPLDLIDPISADVNWLIDLPFNHHFLPGEEQKVVAYVTFSIFSEGRFIPVSLTSA